MDLTQWLGYFVNGLKTQMLEVRGKGELAIKKEVVLEKTGKLDLNERQLRAVRCVVGKISLSALSLPPSFLRRPSTGICRISWAGDLKLARKGGEPMCS